VAAQLDHRGDWRAEYPSRRATSSSRQPTHVREPATEVLDVVSAQDAVQIEEMRASIGKIISIAKVRQALAA